MFQFVQKRLPCFHALGTERQLCRAQFTMHDHNVHWDIFNEQNVNLLFHGSLLLRIRFSNWRFLLLYDVDPRKKILG